MYSRDKPSRRYRTMVELYREMHVEGDRTIGIPSERTFAGGSLLPHVSEIKQLTDESGERKRCSIMAPAKATNMLGAISSFRTAPGSRA